VFDHVTIRVAGRQESERFYSTVLGALGRRPTSTGDDYAEWDDFSIAAAGGLRPATRALHIGFAAPSREHVDAFWRSGTAAGYADDGAPGPRPEYGDDYYGGFLRDPDGNSAEAVHHGSVRQDGTIDHLWVRVADVGASRDFYATIGPQAGFMLTMDSPARCRFAGASGSFSVVAGEPTENMHLAFPAADDEAVREFHRAAVTAGYRDDGGPGERPVYHDGYYAAFVLDPDGNSVELVNHNR
jgi:catechol 2,3-dioxygenase-like lactoylglutathione lyase family enzyme